MQFYERTQRAIYFNPGEYCYVIYLYQLKKRLKSFIMDIYQIEFLFSLKK